MIAALCTTSNSVYETIPGVDCYDVKRNARSFTDNRPVICHPPCRGWSAFMAHFANPIPGEKDLAYFCAEQVMRNGGVIEHPKHSRFVKLFMDDPKWKIITIHQEWFGYPIQKATWLLMPSHYEIPELPFSLQAPKMPGEQKRIFENMSHRQRHLTSYSLALWLISLIRMNN